MELSIGTIFFGCGITLSLVYLAVLCTVLTASL